MTWTWERELEKTIEALKELEETSPIVCRVDGCEGSPYGRIRRLLEDELRALQRGEAEYPQCWLSP